jgi:hypothetical protein
MSAIYSTYPILLSLMHSTVLCEGLKFTYEAPQYVIFVLSQIHLISYEFLDSTQTFCFEYV